MKVRFAARALRQATSVARWWRRNRAAAPFLFDEELDALVATLRAGNALGTEYPARDGTRRALLPRSRYHVYYEIERDDGIVVLAIWHTARGREPRLD